MVPKKITRSPENKKSAAGIAPSSPTPITPKVDEQRPAAVPLQTHPAQAPASAFQLDPVAEPKRGPGRPPAICDKCGKPRSECKGHEAAKFSIGDETVKGLIELVSQLAAYSFALSTDAPIEKLQPVWKFTEGEKAILVPPAAELINKNAPEWLIKYETEIKLGFIAIPLLVAKLAATHAIVKAYKEKAAQENSSTPAAPKPLSTAAAA